MGVKQEQIDRITSLLKTNSENIWKDTEFNQEISQENTLTKCPYNICRGNGWYITKEGGYEFGKKCKCHEELVVKNRLDFAQIPAEFSELSIRDFDINLYQDIDNKKKAQIAKNIAVRYVEKFDSMRELGRGLYFYSEAAGSGKTRLAISIGNSLVKFRNQSVRYITTVDLLGKIRDSWNDKSENSEEQLVNEFVRAQVLILDDIGVEGNKEWISNVFYRIMNNRLVAKRITIITSNIQMEKINFDYRLKSRLKDMVMQVNMPEESVRSSLADNKNELMMQELFGVSDK